jgi:hypothetical protein
MPNTNSATRTAQANKNDEFYTLMVDIENELSKYDFEQFKNKVVYCNCDDPTWSNFFKFFTKWGKKMGIKEVHFTNYANGKRQFKQLTLFEQDDLIESIEDDKKGTAHHWIFTPETNKIVKKELKDNGDFRSDECIEILKNSDIIITNPPFSLFRKFITMNVAEYNKRILVIGGQNAITTKEIFTLIKQNKIWIGNNYHLSGFIDGEGKKLSKNDNHARASCWFTNLEVSNRKVPLVLHPQDLTKYRKYDNYNAIEVPKTKLIPDNYDKEMGVPITFLQKYCPEQFEIIDGIGRYSVLNNEETKKAGKYLSMINGVAKYFRIIIKRRKTQ